MELKLSKAQTDNSFLDIKIQLRADYLPNKKNISVLDCYSGNGTIWTIIKSRFPDRTFEIVRLEKKITADGIYLNVDNEKYLASIELNDFDIIDLDAYGVPYKQLKILFQKGYKGIVFVTFIQSGMGRLPNGLLYDLGYSKQMVKKIPTLFSKNGLEKFKNFLWLNGIKRINYYQVLRKTYLHFNIH